MIHKRYVLNRKIVRGKQYTIMQNHPQEQVSQLSPINLIVFHEPHVVESISYINPMACLFRQIPDLVRIREGYLKLITIFKKYNLHYAELTDVLLRDVNKLRGLAAISCRYDSDQKLKDQKNPTITQEYLKSVLAELDAQTLVSLIYSRPVIHLKKEDLNTFIAIDKIDINPLSNLIFLEDQQIYTDKGLILCNSGMTARQHQTQVVKTCYQILRIPITAITPEGVFIQGGDHMIISKGITLLHVGNRTNMAGAQFLMNKQLAGTPKFAVVKNNGDFSSDRSHLDTFFNVINQDTVIFLDFEDPDLPKQATKTVDLYKQNDKGEYVLQFKDKPFEKFFHDEGFKTIKVSSKEQQELMINFLHLGKMEDKYVVVTCNRNLQKYLKEHNVKNVEIELVEEFKEVGKLEGSLHSAVQTFRCLQR